MKRITLRLTDQNAEGIAERATKEGISQNDVINQLLTAALNSAPPTDNMGVQITASTIVRQVDRDNVLLSAMTAIQDLKEYCVVLEERLRTINSLVQLPPSAARYLIPPEPENKWFKDIERKMKWNGELE